MQVIYEDWMLIMIDDGKVFGFVQQGCWQICYDGQCDVLKQFIKVEIVVNLMYMVIKKNDVCKYLFEIWIDLFDWKIGKIVEELNKIKVVGGFVDLIQWCVYCSDLVGMSDDGYVFEWCNFDVGKNMFGGNVDVKIYILKYMWDVKKVGYKLIIIDQLYKGEYFLICEKNVVVFDLNVGWKEGDMVLDYFMSCEDVKGLVVDNNFIVSWKDGMWMLVMICLFGLFNFDDKILQVGGVYNVGFVVYDDNIMMCGYYILFVKMLGLGVKKGIKVDVNVVKLF